MLKNTFFFLVALVVFLVSSNQVAALHNPHSPHAIPEKSGVYNDPDHPGMKVRVFVHGERPTQTSSSILACNLADPDSTTSVAAAGWRLPSNWTYNLNSSSVPSSVGSQNLGTIVSQSLSRWRSASGDKVTFSEGPQTIVARQSYDGKNIVAWGRINGSALGITYKTVLLQ